MKHDDSLRPGLLKHQLLDYYEDIRLSVGLLFETHYVGEKPGEATAVIAVYSKSQATIMSNTTQDNFEQSIMEFLQDSHRARNITILDVQVIDQVLIIGDNTSQSRFLQREEDDDPSSFKPASTVEVSVNVVGEYRPPPEVDFSGVVEDAIDAEPQALEKSIRRSDEYFDIFEKIKVLSSPSNITDVPTPSPSGDNSAAKALAAVFTLLLVGFAVFLGYFYYRRRQKNNVIDAEVFVEESGLLQEKRKTFSGFRGRRSGVNGTIMDESSTDMPWGPNDVGISDHYCNPRHTAYPYGHNPSEVNHKIAISQQSSLYRDPSGYTNSTGCSDKSGQCVHGYDQPRFSYRYGGGHRDSFNDEAF